MKITHVNWNKIYGIKGSDRGEPYTDLNDVLNGVGVMAERDKVPSVYRWRQNFKRKPAFDYSLVGKEYYIPKNWRKCLYEDLETGLYYIVSPHPENDKKTVSWIAFQLNGLREGLRKVYYDENRNIIRETVYHTGSFMDLIKNHDINLVLDTLARQGKPVRISIRERFCNLSGDYIAGTVYGFDV